MTDEKRRMAWSPLLRVIPVPAANGSAPCAVFAKCAEGICAAATTVGRGFWRRPGQITSMPASRSARASTLTPM